MTNSSTNNSPNIKKTRVLRGLIVSDKMQKTAVIAITRLIKHSKLKKYYKITKRFKAHHEDNKYKTGDTVEIMEVRPISKEKHWKIIRKIR